MNLKTLYQRIRETGTIGKSPEEKKIIVLVNTLSLFTGFFALTLGPLLAVATKQQGIMFPAILEGMAFVSIIFINRAGWNTAASILMLVAQNFSAFYFGLLFGPMTSSALELLMLCLVSASLLIFRSLTIRVATIALAIIGVVAFELNFKRSFVTPLDLSIENQYIVRWLAVGTIFFLNLVVIFQYVRQTDKTKELEIANLYKTLYLQETSHEIRSPLNAIFGISQLLLMQLEKSKQRGRDKIELNAILPLAEHLYAASYSVRGIINNILDLAKIQKGKTDDITADHIEPTEWLKDIVNTHTYISKQKNVKIQLEVDRRMPAVIIADAVKLMQIVNNLISNAIKFSPQNASINVSLAPKENTWQLRISDEGPGIKQGFEDKIFDAFVFEKVDFFESTGLGLSISKRFAELMGGELQLESTGDKGSVFLLTCPLQIGNKSRVQDLKPTIFESEYKDLHVLIIEDNLMSQMIISKFLTEMNCIISVAGDGREGIDLAHQQKPDLIFLDTHMPVLNGLDALKEIRKSSDLSNIPVVVVSGDAFKESIEEIMVAGANDYITKPVEFKQLQHILQKYFKEEPHH
ncbi:MAG: response regulator [Chitinophaga sp.]|uniref:ATP-binding response regulator n=1 Tax=Chitinophaga sp. TaxID=1869181 RepID=UPI0025C58716|nr:response regulator [Chitinophaga sp.]MBV8251503.1 response regulator [Chitinophaga sp.]